MAGNKTSNDKTRSRASRAGRKRWTVGRVIKYLFLAGVLAAVLLVAVTAISVGRLDPENIYSSIEQTSYLYDINGEQIDTLHYSQNRQIVSINDMPEELKEAFIAIEDKTFYKHHGFNWRRMFGAILSSFTHKTSISGTSTITQQLARNVYLADIKSQRSLRRKFTEMYIAWRLEKALTKDQILEAYLNTIYLGYGSYGIHSAAMTYFSKSVDELTLAECAALAALPQAPDSYALITDDPGDGRPQITDVRYYRSDEVDELDDETTEDTGYNDYYNSYYYDSDDEEESAETGLYANDLSKERRELVLGLMVEQGYISQSEADEADVELIDLLHPSIEQKTSVYTYVADYVSAAVIQDLMKEFKMTEEEAQQMVYTGGLKIYTTIDSDLQNIIWDEFSDDSNFPDAIDGSEVQACMVVADIENGYINAMVGGRNAEGAKLFNRTVSPRQPGSSIKPLSVYGAALQKSFDYAQKNQKFEFTDYGIDDQGVDYWGDYITAGSTVVDEPLTINGEEWPQNVTRSFSGYNTFRSAIQESINTCAVKILLQVGTDYSIEMLERFGLTTVVKDESEAVNDVNPAALALGAMAYGVTPLEMTMAYSAFPNGGMLNKPVCYQRVENSSGKILLVGKSESKRIIDEGVAWIMTDLLKSVVSEGGGGNARISGVEVGGKTGTTNDRFDIWFDGFTPKYAASLWIGTDLNVEMDSGSWVASSLWGKIMRQVADIREGEYREQPSNVIEMGGEYFTSGTEPEDGYYRYGSGDDEEEEEETEEVEEVVPEVVEPETVVPGGSGDNGGSGSGDSGSGGSGESVDPGSGGGSGDGGGSSSGDSGSGDSGGGSGSGDSGSGDGGGGSGSGDSGSGSSDGGGSGSGDSGGSGGGTGDSGGSEGGTENNG